LAPVTYLVVNIEARLYLPLAELVRPGLEVKLALVQIVAAVQKRGFAKRNVAKDHV
jgi:hypothetical protein